MTAKVARKDSASRYRSRLLIIPFDEMKRVRDGYHCVASSVDRPDPSLLWPSKAISA